MLRPILAAALRADAARRPKSLQGDFETRAILALALRAPSPKRFGVQNRSRRFCRTHYLAGNAKAMTKSDVSLEWEAPPTDSTMYCRPVFGET